MVGSPVFVVGIERSGTSLMYALLASHPNISMTRRTNLWRCFYNQYGDLRQPNNLERCLAGLISYKRLSVLHPDPERLRRELSQGEPSYAALFRLLVSHHLDRVGKPRWGDKSLYTERYIDDVFAVYPAAKVLHMIRDPRDRYASFRTGLLKGTWRTHKGSGSENRSGTPRLRRRSGGGDIGAATARWLASTSHAKGNEQRYRGIYRIVRYEDLVGQPEETVRDVCAFIGEEYVPAMLSMEGAAAFRATGGNSSYGRRRAGDISTNSLSRFHEVMSPSEIAFMQARAGRDMLGYGYQLEPFRFPLGARVRMYSIDWPVNLAWMVARMAADTLTDWRGGRRKPPAHTLTGAQDLALRDPSDSQGRRD